MVKEAYRFALPPLALGAACFLAARRWHGAAWPGGGLIVLGLFIFYFFRDPVRAIPQESGLVVAPADGHVMEIVEEALDSRMGRRVSTFLAIWDVHVQRAPVAGSIVSVEYRPGKFLAAFRPAASSQNEQNVIRMDTPHGPVIVKQIAGAVARRVICWKREGAAVARGERLGLIRFGSRVDLWLPAEAQVAVERGAKVKGGESILARWTSTP